MSHIVKIKEGEQIKGNSIVIVENTCKDTFVSIVYLYLKRDHAKILSCGIHYPSDTINEHTRYWAILEVYNTL